MSLAISAPVPLAALTSTRYVAFDARASPLMYSLSEPGAHVESRVEPPMFAMLKRTGSWIFVLCFVVTSIT